MPRKDTDPEPGITSKRLVMRDKNGREVDFRVDPGVAPKSVDSDLPAGHEKNYGHRYAEEEH